MIWYFSQYDDDADDDDDDDDDEQYRKVYELISTCVFIPNQPR